MVTAFMFSKAEFLKLLACRSFLNQTNLLISINLLVSVAISSRDLMTKSCVGYLLKLLATCDTCKSYWLLKKMVNCGGSI